ncbi:MAG: serine/threonine-protein kinase [Coleofasciculus sp. C1-SOL-03]|jgi:serine/threonine protein kinase|uniref:serine/threonine protein kinase n=1 Tax=Coleofasciculus sp. C1-SOL-03 TaxID=3069522 RepID=UPI0032F777E3
MLQLPDVVHQHYQLQQKLGQNASRQTWLAMDLSTQPSQPVILKLLAFNPQMQWEDLKLFEREAEVLQQLQHPRIPRYRDYFSLDKQSGGGLPWFGLVQDYIPGASLQQWLDQGKRFTEVQVRQIATEVLEILGYLHALNPPVLHRDIKPSNLIWGEDERVYLVDFGAVQDQTAVEGVTFTVVGTTGYAPLEQFWGKAVPASDLYALGATLIHLATGVAPADLPQRQMRVQFRHYTSLNSTLVHWIETLTEPELEPRYSSASQALEDLKFNRVRQSFPPATRQPLHSRIRWRKSPQQFRIQFPARGGLLTTAIKLGLGRILQKTFPLFLSVLISAEILILWGMPILFLQSNPLFFGLLALTIILAWLGTIKFRVMQHLEPKRGHQKLAKVGVQLIFRLGFGLTVGLVGVGLVVLAVIFAFTSGHISLGFGLAIAVLFGWLIIRGSTKLATLSNPVSFFLFGHHRLDLKRDILNIQRFWLGFCYDTKTIDISQIETIKTIPFQEILIQTESTRYTVAQELTEPERDWLVQEIKDWLNEG